MLMKICSWHDCKNLVDYDVKYCSIHEIAFRDREKERYKEYALRKQVDVEYLKHKTFYNSKGWQNVRDSIISKFFNLDLIEYYKFGRIIQGERVHHIIPLDRDYNLRLDVDNLIYLTERNHRRIHAEYDKGEDNYKKTVKMLIELKKIFIEEFGI